MSKDFLKKIQNKSLFFLISIADTLIWLFFKLTPSKFSIKFLKKRFWKKFKINPNPRRKLFLKNKVKFSAMKLAKKSLFSSCLSRSTICMILLELFGIEVDLFLGIYMNKNKRKTPHCWIKTNEDGDNITYQIRNCSTIIKI